MVYDPAAFADEARQIWQQLRVGQPDLSTAQRPYYNLMMFPYPSAEGLHVGNMYAFTGADVHGRFRRMQGYDVFEPIGLDGFGIHSENYALKVGRHPKEQAAISQERFYAQLQAIGNAFAWENRLETYDPKYYRWTQWLFAEMFRHGLAYRGVASVNYCPSCKTVLADEQVEDGRCERCKNEVERREMASWYFRITQYGDQLLDNIDNYEWIDAEGKKRVGLDWPNKVTTAQRNWIGRSDGLEIDFALAQEPPSAPLPQEGGSWKPPSTGFTQEGGSLSIWTKYWETIFGVTYLVLAPEHEMVATLTKPEQRAAVEAYCQAAKNKSDQDRQAAKEKTGVFTGSYAINPANGARVPIWVADYVLSGVGTGAVMGVPAHDERDFQFARHFGLPVIQVVQYADVDIDQAVAAGERSYEGEGTLVHSGAFDGQDAWGEGKSAIAKWLVEQGCARWRRHYHLRDWIISRQRYWGAPIPLLHCQACAAAGRGERADHPGWYTVPDDQLPVELPDLDDYIPQGDGKGPLANADPAWRETTCPACGAPAQRETDVCDTFLDSSWYFLRYPAVTHPQAEEQPFPQINDQNQWFPINAYVGGAEHAVLHLLYSRFIAIVLHEWGLLPSPEPFPFLFGHGLIVKDGAKMSKSRGNVVNPDEYIAKYGADALRCYLMFLGPYSQGGDFRDTGMQGMDRWLRKVASSVLLEADAEGFRTLQRELNRAVAANTREMGEFKFNTCLARLMTIMNIWQENPGAVGPSDKLTFLKLLAPMAPHLAEVMYQRLRPLLSPEEAAPQSIHLAPWPEVDAEALVDETIKIPVQVNGKLRSILELETNQKDDVEAVRALVLGDAKVQAAVAGRELRKYVYVPGKIVNLVV